MRTGIAYSRVVVVAHAFNIPALGRQRQADLCEFETSLIYRASSRTHSKATEKPCLRRGKKRNSLHREQSNIVSV